MKTRTTLPLLTLCVPLVACPNPEDSGEDCALGTPDVRFALADANQAECYDPLGDVIDCPASDGRFYGQDAQYSTLAASYTPMCDGAVVVDDNTGLQWEAAHHEGTYYGTAEAWCEDLTLGGADDWRMPTITELLSISEWNGSQHVDGAFYLDGSVFDFDYPDLDDDDLTGTHSNQMMGQTWSSTRRSDQDDPAMDSVYFFNFLDAHIKSNSAAATSGTISLLFYRCVRGAELDNSFTANDDGTVSDAAGLVWQASNGSVGGELQMDWETALAYCEDLGLADRTDWRLPDVKELQSIVEYAPVDWDENRMALDTSIFDFELPEGKDLHTSPTTSPPDGTSVAPYFWSSTTHGDNTSNAAYVCFGSCWAIEDQGMDSDVHGPGALRSDPKDDQQGQLWAHTESMGDQLDAVQVYNFVRCVAGGV
jgi:hypothetical protein